MARRSASIRRPSRSRSLHRAGTAWGWFRSAPLGCTRTRSGTRARRHTGARSKNETGRCPRRKPRRHRTHSRRRTMRNTGNKHPRYRRTCRFGCNQSWTCTGAARTSRSVRCSRTSCSNDGRCTFRRCRTCRRRRRLARGPLPALRQSQSLRRFHRQASAPPFRRTVSSARLRRRAAELDRASTDLAYGLDAQSTD
jgi:hypothetical protein